MHVKTITKLYFKKKLRCKHTFQISTIGSIQHIHGAVTPHVAGQAAPGVFANPYGQYYNMLMNYYRGLQARGLLQANRHQQVVNPYLVNNRPNLALSGLRTQQHVSNLGHVGYNIFQKKKDDYKYPTGDKYHNDNYPGDYYHDEKYPDGKYGHEKYPAGDKYKNDDKYSHYSDSIYPPHGHHNDKYPGDYYPGGKYPDGKYPKEHDKYKKNDKYDSIYPHGHHNDKYPGDYYPEGKYPDGKYPDYPVGDKYKKNDKYPQGYDSIYPHGQHHGDYYPGGKYPDGKHKDYYPHGHDAYPGNTYDSKYPSGHDGHYRDHTYKDKYPKESYDKYPQDYSNHKYNDKYPKDYHNDKYNDKYHNDPHYPGSDRYIKPNYRAISNHAEFAMPVSNFRGDRLSRGGGLLRGGAAGLGRHAGVGGNQFLFSDDIPEPVHSSATLAGGLLDLGPIGRGGSIGGRVGRRRHHPHHPHHPEKDYVHTDKYPGHKHKDYKYETYPKKDYDYPKKHLGDKYPDGKYGTDHYNGQTYKKDYTTSTHGGHYQKPKSKKTY